MKMTANIKQRNTDPKRNSPGFTLLEVLVAMVILAVGLLGMASLSIGIIKGNSFSKEISSATTCAREKMEDVEQLGFANTPASDTTVTEAYNSITQYPYCKRETVTVVDNPGTDMKTVTVTVYWDSDSHQVQLKTFLAK